jgi:NAD(P)H-hydrate epimerase
VIPLLTAEQMRTADAAAVHRVGEDALVEAAGYAVGGAARDMLGHLYGRRVAVVAGPGLNGSDGRVAARWLTARGARVDVLEASSAPRGLGGYDLVIDAAFGLGCTRPYFAPDVVGDAAVLAVDLPSGVDPDTGTLLGRPMVADVTLALGAIKPAHLVGPAVEFVGSLRFAGLGIVDSAESGLVETADLAHFVRQHRDDHKWRHAVFVLAGSATMPGAADLVTEGAIAAGASMVRVCVPGIKSRRLSGLPSEAVRVDSSVAGLADISVAISPRLQSLVIGPGLGRDPQLRAQVRAMVTRSKVPLVLDADGLHAVDPELLAHREHPESPVILTPHDGEYTVMVGHEPGEDRLQAARDLAAAAKSVVLLKGPTTVIADPSGAVRIVTAGTPALATAGTGDVLAGMIAGALARGHAPLQAAALSAHLHGLAGARLGPYGSALQLRGAVTEVLGEVDHAG